MAIALSSDTALADVKSDEKGFFSRILSKMVAARQIEADRQIAQFLRTLDAETLAELGYGPIESK